MVRTHESGTRSHRGTQLNSETIDEEFSPIVVTLRGGRRATLRSIRPDDAEALQVALRRLSTESRYMRVMSAVNKLLRRRC